MIRITTLLFLIALLGFGCQQTAPPEEQPAAATAPAPTANVTTLPAYPLDSIKYLFDKTDYIDYVFYHENFSLNQSEKPAIQSSIAGISPEAVGLNPICKPIGRIFFQIAGVNAAEADIYLQDECVAYVFMRDNRPAYANKMTQQLLQFYVNIFAQVQQGKPQGQ